MLSLPDIFEEFALNPSDIDSLSEEASAVAVGCGKMDNDKALSEKTWDLFYSISERVWQPDLSLSNKIRLDFDLFELFPSYYHFFVPFYHLIKNEEISDDEDKQIIWKRFGEYLGGEPYYADPVGYVLWVEFFEDITTMAETWHGVLSNIPNEKALHKLLLHAGPVAYELKEKVYKELLPNRENHETIFTSILFSAFDAYGQVDQVKALELLSNLAVDKDSYDFNQLNLKLTDNDG